MSAPSVRERTISTNGVDLHVVEAGEQGAPVVLLCHGFPELAYSWRHQIPALAEAGYHVLAPDQRGYGQSSRPSAIEDYDIVNLTADACGVLDAVGAESAVFVGHDWGSMVVWQSALLHPERVRAVCGMSVPFAPRGPMPPTELMKMAFGDGFFYILYFQEPGVADANLGADPARTMRGMLAGLEIPEGQTLDASALAQPSGAGFVERLPQPEKLPAWLSEDELDHYIAEFSRTGFTGGINWYRNFDRNWKATEHLDGAHVTQPSLFIGGKLDPVLVMSPPGLGNDHLDDHRGDVIIDGAGHWVQQEKPAEVNDALLAWLKGL
jgi:pimeloyl-ACP methyl ester carboxylesterase